MAETVKEVQDYYGNLKGCCLGADTEALLPLITEVLYFCESEPDEAGGWAAVRLQGDEYAILNEWQDYTGHGCQCGCKSERGFMGLDTFLKLGLDPQQRELVEGAARALR